jgi:hypothetical protein
MLFRNPFRFGKPVPWKPAGDTKAEWKINEEQNILSLSGFEVGSIEHVEPYNQLYFANSTLNLHEGKVRLKAAWSRILGTLQASQSGKIPLAKSVLIATAVSLSFSLNRETDPQEQLKLLHEFVAYIEIVFADEQDMVKQYIPQDLIDESKAADGYAFGKPVWDFKYPEASVFITNEGLVGCASSTTRPGDVVLVALGSSYPIVLRPDNDEKQHFTIRGFAYVHGIMDGERLGSGKTVFKIR